MKTQSEKLLIQRRRQKGVLLPLLYDLFEKPVQIEDESDVKFMLDLMKLEWRKNQERSDLLYSPSSLGGCLRRVYLYRHFKELGIQPESIPFPETNAIFFEGTFKHYKWLFALHKLERRHPDFRILAIEERVVSKHGDHGGTPDAIVAYQGDPLLVDVKSANVYSFNKMASGDIPLTYRIQLTDYMMLANASRKFARIREHLGKIDRAILLVESKGGMSASHPLALAEVEIHLEDSLADVQSRLRRLREFHAQKEIPDAECRSLQARDFQSCPFAGYCRKEVKRNQRDDLAVRNAEKRTLTVARPTGDGRSRRTRSRKRSRPS